MPDPDKGVTVLSSTRPTRRTRRVVAATAGVATLALALTACGGSDGDDTASGDEKITLTVATFNQFGYTDELLARYTEDHPNITVKQVKAATADDALANLQTKLAAGGAGLADVEAVDVDWFPKMVLQYPDLFEDLSDPELDGRWLDWKVEQATTPDGKLLGYGTDIGPSAICYRADLFEKAGLPSDPDKVAELLGGDDATWDDYLEVGKKFTAKSDAAWYDSSQPLFQSMINQLEAPYEDPESGEPKDLKSNKEVRDVYDTVTQASADGLSAGFKQWEEDWNASFQKDAFATQICPPWMTGPIEGNSGGVDGWNVADVLPGGGSNWGGSFLTVPASGEHTAEAKELAAWLTNPENQTAAFEEAGTFPSQVDAQASDAVQSYTNSFFNDAPVGKIFTKRAEQLKTMPFKGTHFFDFQDALMDATLNVDRGEDPQAAWDKAVQTANASAGS
ncbi:extracellular solute-binding protein [Isoptericola sp. F-RaC21]|uniref:ABC transporter substrate-binding protein n=1 Tax=Isoptericola sp. F-RaC21 TaxID=3141452 RepID=UPI00315BF8D7